MISSMNSNNIIIIIITNNRRTMISICIMKNSNYLNLLYILFEVLVYFLLDIVKHIF